MAISSPGLGSNLDVNSIVKQLMAVEAQPKATLAKKEASFQAKLSAFGTLSGAVSAFQSAVASLDNPSKFLGMTTYSGDASIVSSSVASKAAAGTYNVSVNQLASAQTLVSTGHTNSAAKIGADVTTTLTFQFGTISGGNFVSTGNKLNTGVATSGIAANSLTLNGTAIVTSGTTTSAKELATQINLVNGTTGVTATALPTDTGMLGGFTTTADAGTYTLTVGGVNIVNNAPVGSTAADIDAALTPGGAADLALQAAGIAFSGAAADGTLKFTKADGSNIAIQESGAGATGGFSAAIGIGSTKTYTSSVSLSSANPITVAGSNPSAAGFTAGTLSVGVYSGATFTQDATQPSAAVTINSSNNSLQGIRDAINKANIGVTASIVSDGSTSPYHLILKSNKTGATSSMKISVSGDADVSNLLSYDPAGTQKMQQSSAAQSTAITVNGVAVTSTTNTVTDAIQGTTLTANKIGSTTVHVSRDTNSVSTSVTSFVAAYNDLNKTLKDLTKYDAATKQAGTLIGDPTVRAIQAGVRQMLSNSITDLSGNIKTLSDIGVTFQKDGTLSLDSGKLQTAINNNFDDIGKLFAAIGTPTDSLVSFTSSTSATKPGAYAVSVSTMATQGKVVGDTGANLTITQGVNDELSMTIDGVTTTLKLTAGIYSTVTALTSHVQSLINGTSAFSAAGIAVKVTADGSNKLTITSNRYGSASNVSVIGNGANDLLGAGRASTPGVDVAGSIGSVVAVGSGQTLTGATGSAAEGLKLEITGGLATDRGSITYSHGYAHLLKNLVDSYIGSKGFISARTDGINSSIKDIRKQQENFDVRLASLEKRYRAQFTALDKAISSMSKTSNFLTQQLAQLSKTE